MKLVAVAAPLTLVGCAAVFGIPSDVEQARDAGVEAAALPPPGVDAGPACDLAADFGAPVLLVADAANARLSADELTIFFEANGEVRSATRAARDAAFGTAAVVVGAAQSPSVTLDGSLLFFSRGEPNALSVFRAPGADGAFGTAEPIAIANAGRDLRDPYVLGDGHELWFAARETADSDLDLVRAARVETASYTAAPVAKNLATPDSEVAPVLTPDALTVFFASDRKTHITTTEDSLDVYAARRATLAADFSDPALVASVSTDGVAETPSWVSADTCRLYFTRGGRNVFVATRPR